MDNNEDTKFQKSSLNLQNAAPMKPLLHLADFTNGFRRQKKLAKMEKMRIWQKSIITCNS